MVNDDNISNTALDCNSIFGFVLKSLTSIIVPSDKEEGSPKVLYILDTEDAK